VNNEKYDMEKQKNNFKCDKNYWSFPCITETFKEKYFCSGQKIEVDFFARLV